MPIIAFLMFFAIVAILLAGYPVAFTLSGVALIFSLFGVLAGAFDISFLNAIPSRIFGVMSNQTLIAVPLFVFMGVMLEKSRIAEKLLDTLSLLFGSMRGGLGQGNGPADMKLISTVIPAGWNDSPSEFSGWTTTPTGCPRRAEIIQATGITRFSSDLSRL